MSLCAVVVTHNRLNKLQHTLATYLNSDVSAIIVVDNASNDGTAHWLAEQSRQQSRLNVITQAENSGGAGGFYAGLAAARELEGIDWIVISDDDSYPQQEAIEAFTQQYPIRHLESQKDVIASAVFYPNGQICPMNRPMKKRTLWGYVTALLQGRKVTGVDDKDYFSTESIDIVAASFVGLWIKHSVLKKSQVLPEKNYFLYWDDVAFCLDLGNQGYQLAFNPRLRFEHDCFTRNHTVPSGQRLYWLVRNGLRTIKRLPKSAQLIAKLYKLPIWLLIAIKTKSIRYYFQAIKDV